MARYSPCPATSWFPKCTKSVDARARTRTHDPPVVILLLLLLLLLRPTALSSCVCRLPSALASFVSRPILIPFVLVVGNSFSPGGPLVDEKSLVFGFTVLTIVYE